MKAEKFSALAEPFPPEWVQERRVPGGASLSYVPWYRYVERLNEVVGEDWSVHVDLLEAGDKLICVAHLTVMNITRCNVGDEDEDKSGYGSAATNAYAQALKRSAALFGMGLEFYGGEAPVEAKPKSSSPAGDEIACPKCDGQMWDNRDKKKSGAFNPRSPDLACRDKDGCGYAIWLDSWRDDLLRDANAAHQLGAIDTDVHSKMEEAIQSLDPALMLRVHRKLHEIMV